MSYSWACTCGRDKWCIEHGACPTTGVMHLPDCPGWTDELDAEELRPLTPLFGGSGNSGPEIPKTGGKKIRENTPETGSKENPITIQNTPQAPKKPSLKRGLAQFLNENPDITKSRFVEVTETRRRYKLYGTTLNARDLHNLSQYYNFRPRKAIQYDWKIIELVPYADQE